MPKNSFRKSSNSKSRVSKSKSKSKSRSKSKSNRKKRGGFKTVLPMRFFNPSHNAHYQENPVSNPHAVSHGVGRNK